MSQVPEEASSSSEESSSSSSSSSDIRTRNVQTQQNQQQQQNQQLILQSQPKPSDINASAGPSFSFLVLRGLPDIRRSCIGNDNENDHDNQNTMKNNQNSSTNSTTTTANVISSRHQTVVEEIQQHKIFSRHQRRRLVTQFHQLCSNEFNKEGELEDLPSWLAAVDDGEENEEESDDESDRIVCPRANGGGMSLSFILCVLDEYPSSTDDAAANDDDDGDHDRLPVVVGGTTVEFYPSARSGMCGYVVVDPCMRGRGVAPKLISEAVQLLKQQAEWYFSSSSTSTAASSSTSTTATTASVTPTLTSLSSVSVAGGGAAAAAAAAAPRMNILCCRQQQQQHQQEEEEEEDEAEEPATPPPSARTIAGPVFDDFPSSSSSSSSSRSRSCGSCCCSAIAAASSPSSLSDSTPSPPHLRQLFIDVVQVRDSPPEDRFAPVRQTIWQRVGFLPLEGCDIIHPGGREHLGRHNLAVFAPLARETYEREQQQTDEKLQPVNIQEDPQHALVAHDTVTDFLRSFYSDSLFCCQNEHRELSNALQSLRPVKKTGGDESFVVCGGEFWM